MARNQRSHRARNPRQLSTLLSRPSRESGMCSSRITRAVSVALVLFMTLPSRSGAPRLLFRRGVVDVSLGIFLAGFSSLRRCYNGMTKAKLVSNGHIVAWRAAHWANWHFEIQDYAPDAGVDPESKQPVSSITFGKGGFQGARGGRGSDWYISNVFEELDAKTEFYYDIDESTLFYFSNSTEAGKPPHETFVATKLTYSFQCYWCFSRRPAGKFHPERDWST